MYICMFYIAFDPHSRALLCKHKIPFGQLDIHLNTKTKVIFTHLWSSASITAIILDPYQCRGVPEGSVWAVGWSDPEHQLVVHPLPPASLFHLRQEAANSFILSNQMEQNQCLFQKSLLFIQNESSSLVLLGFYCNRTVHSCTAPN